MSGKRKLIIGLVIAVLLAGGGAFAYYRMAAPPGEEWISYDSKEVTAEIDRQLSGLDMESLIKNKEHYVVEKSISDIQKAVKAGELSRQEITAICLYRIKTLDQSHHGYNSVISINPHAMEEAKRQDEQAGSGENSGDLPLLGIPVMLKDNINTADMPASAGAAALADFTAKEDAELVKKLKSQGAIILGKNNLSEFANYMSSVMPAGYSGRKGQTVNPFDPLKISPSGSSSGSAVAVTANLVPVSIGTETDGSIVAPSSANSVVGFKPTRGHISAEGILPLIKEIDTPGPIARTVQDAALVYSSASQKDVSPEWNKEEMKGKHIGLVKYEYSDEEMLKKLKASVEDMGARVTEVAIDEKDIDVFTNIKFSFKKDFEDFAQTYNLPIKKLDDLIAFNKEDPDRRCKYGQDLLEEANERKEADLKPIETAIKNADSVLAALFDENRLDGLVFLGSSGSSAPAAAGYPELTVPFGKDGKGVPQGATFVTRHGEDEKLLNLGYSFEANTGGREQP
ncbi:amidase family protein [Anaerovorax odorimutans]|uniref:Amidase family protein n=1 Tax=Anaerovorax odorimutans TaxID=109327 RepID=A0ABT1RJZ6_9FIRM|nr:amidase family protein [Anaerovorax odorimutans]MCQ4635507.1 amidase family protein [Anaerovorax odorimutans]